MTGIVSCNGEISLGVYEYARENQKVIGEDISIVSFGNLREAGWVNPMLTSIIQRGEQMGRKAVEVLISRIPSHMDHVITLRLSRFFKQIIVKGIHAM